MLRVQFEPYDFNPRSREGSDVCFRVDEWLTINFNPRSREGSDGFHQIVSISQRHFNPRSREGSDDNSLSVNIDRAIISIHAPARGATKIGGGNTSIHIFQSTLPRGERRYGAVS